MGRRVSLTSAGIGQYRFGRAHGKAAFVVPSSTRPRVSRIAFGRFCLSPRERLLTCDGIPMPIGGRSIDLLSALVAEPGRVVTKRELLQRVWPDVVVEEGSLRFHMAALRKILGDGIDGARFISTKVGVGYAFVMPVHEQEDEAELLRPAAPVRSSAATPSSVGNLPMRLTRLVGREADIELLIDRLAETRLYSIVGAAGVGKTALAVEIGHIALPDFAGKARFVDFGALEDPALVASAIANALRLPVQADDPMTVILGHLRSERILLILDNCEHVIGEVASVVERIGEAAPDVRILATSREPLRVLDEHVHWLGPLAYPAESADMSLDDLVRFPAVALFIERAVAAHSGLAMDLPAVREVAEICRRLDGMALPIELIAVRVATHGLEATSRLIGERFSLAWTGRRTAVRRHQTLQATLDWSYDLLSDAERRTLEKLSVFLGAFSMDAALHVVIDETIDAGAAATALDGLTAKSLVALDRGTSHNPYRLLEMTRAYAREKLDARDKGLAVAIAGRHAAYYQKLLEDVLAPDGSLSKSTARIDGQIGNIRSALGACFDPGGDRSLGARLAAVSAPIFFNMSLLGECRFWCASAVAALDESLVGTGIELELQAALGLTLMFTRGNSEVVETALRRALDIAVALGDAWKQLNLLGRLHIFHERIGDYATAHQWARMALAVAEGIGDPEAIAVASSFCGISLHLAGDQLQARDHLERSIRLGLPSERWRTIHYGFDHRNRSLIALARTFWLLGYADRARSLAEEAVEIAARLDHPTTHCIALIWALPIYVATGDFAKAAQTLDTLAAVSEINGFGPYIAAVGGLRGNQAVRLGRAEEALAGLEESLARLRAARYELLTVSLSISLSLALLMVGRLSEACQLLNELIDRCNANDERIYMPDLLRLKARVLARSGTAQPDEIEALLEEALSCSRRQGALAWELRAAMDLARLQADRNRPADAIAVLEPVRRRFEEGFDTVDLRQADLLLQELASSEGTRPKRTDWIG